MIKKPGRIQKPKEILKSSQRQQFGEKIYHKYIPVSFMQRKKPDMASSDSDLVFRKEPLSELLDLLKLLGEKTVLKGNQTNDIPKMQIYQTILYQIQNHIQLIQWNPSISIELKNALKLPEAETTDLTVWLCQAQEAVQKELKKNATPQDRISNKDWLTSVIRRQSHLQKKEFWKEKGITKPFLSKENMKDNVKGEVRIIQGLNSIKFNAACLAAEYKEQKNSFRTIIENQKQEIEKQKIFQIRNKAVSVSLNSVTKKKQIEQETFWKKQYNIFGKEMIVSQYLSFQLEYKTWLAAVLQKIKLQTQNQICMTAKSEKIKEKVTCVQGTIYKTQKYVQKKRNNGNFINDKNLFLERLKRQYIKIIKKETIDLIIAEDSLSFRTDRSIVSKNISNGTLLFDFSICQLRCVKFAKLSGLNRSERWIRKSSFIHKLESQCKEIEKRASKYSPDQKKEKIITLNESFKPVWRSEFVQDSTGLWRKENRILLHNILKSEITSRFYINRLIGDEKKEILNQRRFKENKNLGSFFQNKSEEIKKIKSNSQNQLKETKKIRNIFQNTFKKIKKTESLFEIRLEKMKKTESLFEIRLKKIEETASFDQDSLEERQREEEFYQSRFFEDKNKKKSICKKKSKSIKKLEVFYQNNLIDNTKQNHSVQNNFFYNEKLRSFLCVQILKNINKEKVKILPYLYFKNSDIAGASKILLGSCKFTKFQKALLAYQAFNQSGDHREKIKENRQHLKGIQQFLRKYITLSQPNYLLKKLINTKFIQNHLPERNRIEEVYFNLTDRTKESKIYFNQLLKLQENSNNFYKLLLEQQNRKTNWKLILDKVKTVNPYKVIFSSGLLYKNYFKENFERIVPKEQKVQDKEVKTVKSKNNNANSLHSKGRKTIAFCTIQQIRLINRQQFFYKDSIYFSKKSTGNIKRKQIFYYYLLKLPEEIRTEPIFSNNNTIEIKESQAICNSNIIEIKKSQAICNRNIIRVKKSQVLCNRNIIRVKKSQAICDGNIIGVKESQAICNKNIIEVKESQAICNRNTIKNEKNGIAQSKNGIEVKRNQKLYFNNIKTDRNIHLKKAAILRYKSILLKWNTPLDIQKIHNNLSMNNIKSYCEFKMVEKKALKYNREYYNPFFYLTVKMDKAKESEKFENEKLEKQTELIQMFQKKVVHSQLSVKTVFTVSNRQIVSLQKIQPVPKWPEVKSDWIRKEAFSIIEEQLHKHSGRFLNNRFGIKYVFKDVFHSLVWTSAKEIRQLGDLETRKIEIREYQNSEEILINRTKQTNQRYFIKEKNWILEQKSGFKNQDRFEAFKYFSSFHQINEQEQDKQVPDILKKTQKEQKVIYKLKLQMPLIVGGIFTRRIIYNLMQQRKKTEIMFRKFRTWKSSKPDYDSNKLVISKLVQTDKKIYTHIKSIKNQISQRTEWFFFIDKIPAVGLIEKESSLQNIIFLKIKSGKNGNTKSVRSGNHFFHQRLYQKQIQVLSKEYPVLQKTEKTKAKTQRNIEIQTADQTRENSAKNKKGYFTAARLDFAYKNVRTLQHHKNSFIPEDIIMNFSNIVLHKQRTVFSSSLDTINKSISRKKLPLKERKQLRFWHKNIKEDKTSILKKQSSIEIKMFQRNAIGKETFKFPVLLAPIEVVQTKMLSTRQDAQSKFQTFEVRRSIHETKEQLKFVFYKKLTQNRMSEKEQLESESPLEQRLRLKIEQYVDEQIEGIQKSATQESQIPVRTDRRLQHDFTEESVNSSNVASTAFQTQKNPGEEPEQIEEDQIYRRIYERLERNLRLELRRTGRQAK